MKLIVITPSNTIENEHTILGKMLDAGLPTLYVRKSKFTKAELKNYLDGFTKDHRKKIIIHSHYSLLMNYTLKGIHIPKKTRKAFISLFIYKLLLKMRQGQFLIGTSCKSLASLDESYKNFDYIMISPVFTSPYGQIIGFSISTLIKVIPTYPAKIIARGGAVLESIKKAKEIGFSGIAFQEYIWNERDPLEAFQKVLNGFHEEGIAVE